MSDFFTYPLVFSLYPPPFCAKMQARGYKVIFIVAYSLQKYKYFALSRIDFFHISI